MSMVLATTKTWVSFLRNAGTDEHFDCDLNYKCINVNNTISILKFIAQQGAYGLWGVCGD